MRKKENQIEIKHRLEAIEDLVEAHTRTERHLEKYSDIASEEQVNHAQEIQKNREKTIEHLEKVIVTGHHGEDIRQ